MRKTAIIVFIQLLISSPIVLSLIRTFMILQSGSNTAVPLFTGFIVNLILLAGILISMILVISKNKDLTKKSVILHITIATLCLAGSFASAFVISEFYKTTNLFD